MVNKVEYKNAVYWSQSNKMAILATLFHADIPGYYHSTGLSLFAVNCSRFISVWIRQLRGASQFIEYVYKSIVFAPQSSASNYVPSHHVNFYKFWCSQELLSHAWKKGPPHPISCGRRL